MTNDEYKRVRYYDRLMTWTALKAYCSFYPDNWTKIEEALFNRYFP